MATGRTVSRYVRFILGDSGNVLRNIPVNTIGGIGFENDVVDLTAFQDAVKNVMLNLPGATISFGGPFDNTAAAGTPALSGSHIVLVALVDVNVPRSLDIQFGIQTAWTAGDPQFGMTRSATSGVVLTKYTVNPESMMYSAELQIFGSVAPAWGTAAES